MSSQRSASGFLTHETAFGRSVPCRAHRVQTPDGLQVAAQDWSADGAPREAELLLLHGFSQAHGAWFKQFSGPLAKKYRLVTYDLRGHGESDKPEDAKYYRETERWAGEVDSVIKQVNLRRPVLVAWSYSGRVALDYLQTYGDSGISGLVMINATANDAPEMMGSSIAVLRQMTSADERVALEGTMALMAACVARPLPAPELEYMLRYNQMVPPKIRANLAGRPAQYGALLRSLDVPTLAMRGMLDTISAPAMADYIVEHVPNSRLISYAELAHMPFWESPQTFDKDLSEFLDRRVTAA